MADDAARAGLRVLAGLPKDNGLAGLAPDLVDDTSQVVYAVVALRVKDVVQHVDADSQTAVLRFLGVEAELVEDEVRAVRLILDRARVRRTGEQPLFDSAEQPENPGDVLDGTVEDEETGATAQPALASVD